MPHADLVERLRQTADFWEGEDDIGLNSVGNDAREAAATIEWLTAALEEISERCPPFTGDLYATPSDFSHSQDYAEHVEAMVSAGTGDIARTALKRRSAS